MPNNIWQFATAQNLKFGRGCRQMLASQLRRHQVHRPLIITDSNIVGTGVAAAWLDSLQAEVPLVIFDQCQAEPSVTIAIAACDAGRVAGVDGVVGLGGGSNMDVAKVVATVLRHGGQPQDYFGFDRIPAAVLPVFALPTTAGTGSEVSHSAVLTDSL
ncbi:MAG: iron-containing alcohol dehydrogenase, partial [Aureliella sp.]